MEIKYPHISVQLVGEDGNAFAILGRVSKAMRRGKCTAAQVDAFLAEATTGDYNHLLRTTMNTVTCDSTNEDEEYA